MLFLELIYNCVERFQYKYEIDQKAYFSLIEPILTHILNQRYVQEDIIGYGEIVPVKKVNCVLILMHKVYSKIMTIILLLL